MDPISEILLERVLKRASDAGTYSLKQVREHFFADSNEIEQKFNRELRNALSNQAKTSNREEYITLLNEWERVKVNLRDLDTYGLTAEDALFGENSEIINRISESMAIIVGIDLKNNPEIEQELNAVVEEALHEVLELLVERSKEREIQDDLSEFDILISDQIKEIKQEIENIEKTRISSNAFNIYDINTTDLEDYIEMIAETVGVDLSIPYVQRQELDRVENSKTVVIKGRAGSGKSRSQVELARQFIRKYDIQHLIIPTHTTFDLDDIRHLCNMTYEGNVLLIWDDIHKSYTLNRGTDLFTASIERLENEVSKTGSEFYVIGSLRSDEIDQIPSYKKPNSIWNNTITEVELRDLEPDQITDLIENLSQAYNIYVPEDVKSQFGYKVLNSDPSPYYIYSVMSTEEEDKKLTEEKVESYSKTAEEFWERHYENISQEDIESKYLLWSLKILSELRISYYTSLIHGIYHEVFGREKFEFEDNLDKLEEKGWIRVINSNLHRNEVVIIHDLQSEAIIAGDRKSILEICSDEFSDFLLSNIDPYLPKYNMWVEPLLHQNYAAKMMEEKDQEFEEEIEQHLLQSVSTEYELPEARGAYGGYLHRQGREKEAEEMFEKALDLDPFSSISLWQYAVFLEETNRPKAAKTQFELAVQQDPPYPIIYRHYARFLMRQGKNREAINQFDKAISLGSREPMDYLSIASVYGILGKDDKVGDYLKRATDLPDPGINTYILYATWLEDQDHTSEDPLHYVQKAEEIDPTDPKIAAYYAGHRPNAKDHDFLEKVLRKGIDADEENDTYLLALAKLLSESNSDEDRREAIEYYESLLEKGYVHTEIYHDLCALLQSLNMHAKLRNRLDEFSRITTNPGVYFNYAEASRHEGYMKEAECNYLKAFKHSIKYETEYEIDEVIYNSIIRLFELSLSGNSDKNIVEQNNKLRDIIMNSDSKRGFEYIAVLNNIYYQMINK